MRWCISRIQETFGLDTRTVEESLNDQHNFNSLESVLHETASVFVFFQPVYALNELGEWTMVRSEPELIYTDGSDENTRMRCKKACFFLRIGPIDKDVSSCENLLHGEIGDDPLRSLEMSLTKLYKPLYESRIDWGKAQKDQSSEFMESLGKITVDLKESIKSLCGGLELRKSDKKYDLEGKNFSQRGTQEDQELITHYENLLEEWCTEIETYLEGNSDSYEANAVDAGPMTELESWRRRMQRLTSITEQLKTRECKNVIGVLTSLTKNAQDNNRQKVFSLLRRWKQIDINITEAANEAKDNVKYLFTLEKFLEPLYSGEPLSIVDTLPALMNSIKMIHTIARYYNTSERMSGLFFKITNQMISSCKASLTNDGIDLWEQNPESLVKNLDLSLKLNDCYQENYRLTKDKLLTMPKGKQFDFSEQQIFGKFDLFCRRVVKLIDMFSTIHQFRALANHKLEGMESLTDQFNTIIGEFRRKNHDLLDYHNNKFDRDYVEFNVSISQLEMSLQKFINDSFESISSIENSLNLLKKFQAILQRENLKADLDSKFNIIFQNYGLELEIVQQLYEKHKHSPPVPRNLPPVSGNIMWSRHLLKRIEDPMKKFENNQSVLSSKDAKRIIKTYNKVARTLVAFEYLWFQAWQQSIETAKAGLQATLIIRHPEDDKLYVNFDQEILQLIREAKSLDRIGIDIPESARIVLLQESKFKAYYNDLQYALKEYERVAKRVIPVAVDLLEPHMKDMEYKLRPGMITLTWTSMNIDAYKHHIHTGLQKLEELVTNINDIIENRIEKNLKTVSKTVLVDLPSDRSTLLSDFVAMQEKRITVQSKLLHGKNVEIENAVNDLVQLVTIFPLDPHISPVGQVQIDAICKKYRHKMYCALLKCTKDSLNMIKERVGNRGGGGGFLYVERPFFELFVNLQTPKVQITPDLEDVQNAINKSSIAVLKCSKSLFDWGQNEIPVEERRTFFDEITCDLQIAVVCLLLTGSVQGLKVQVTKYLERFYEYQWLWSDDKDRAYSKFMQSKPSLSEYEAKLLDFQQVDRQINEITSVHVIGAMSINTSTLKNNLRYEVQTWKLTFSRFLHDQARHDMEKLYHYMKQTEQRLKRGEKIRVLVQKESSSSNSDVLQELSSIMDVLREIRERESGIEQEISPVIDMYDMLERFVGSQGLGDVEGDEKFMLRSRWNDLVNYAEKVTDELGELQESFKRKLLRDIKEFVNEVVVFRNDFVANGPMVPGISPRIAVDRLRRFHEEYEIRERKFALYKNGEDLFAIRPAVYPELIKTKKELLLLDQLYKLYTDVSDCIEDWKQIIWEKVRDEIDAMAEKMEMFSTRCQKMPGKLREWEAYKDLKKQIDDFTVVLPLLRSLAKPSVMQRHWTEVSRRCGTELVVGPDFRLRTLLEANLLRVADDIEDICDSADKQLQVQNKIAEIAEAWQLREFEFMEWKQRGIYVFKNVIPILEDLEDAQMQLQTMLTMRHVTPFKNEAQALLITTSDTAETLERWVKVQTLWCSLESVFSGGDIAKQLPTEAKKFQKTDKEFDKVMKKAGDTKNVIQACQNDILKQNLMVFYNELEKCQKSLEGYLEQKRNSFPRFYFVSNPVLLQVLSQGSDPQAIQPYYEKIFDSIDEVVHDKLNPQQINSFFSRMGVTEERVTLSKPVQCKNNIEDWLTDLLKEQQRTMKDITRECATKVASVTEISQLRSIVDDFPGQFALLALQLIWTTDCMEALSSCKTKKTAMKECYTKTSDILAEISSWCLNDLGSKLNRVKIESLVTIQVHQRDVIAELAELHKLKKISDPQDFAWQKQSRFQWRPEDKDPTSDKGSLVISITDVDFQNSYEYLGCTERLVITPLTDRCYITLAQALGMFFGGAPAGPAGTGKTETVKDMGRALGIYVMVHNCTDQMSYKDCAKIFKGLCQGGLWGCFDEFNRIQLPVLSVVAQQVLAIQNSKKSHAETFFFPGDPAPCKLNPTCGFFITMNPGYAGRQELPENLKALFRGVAMMVPDRMIIMKVKLCSVGYTKFTSLAKKFAHLYKLCEEQLSQQKHYDFGLRNILSVLRTCGASKREDVHACENYLMYRTLRDMNLSKLVSQDVPLFLSLLADLFPNTESPPGAQYEDIMTAVKATGENNGLIMESAWIQKVVQLYETYLVRHGIMMVGTSGGGKTEIINVLASALTKTTGVTINFSRLNPKAIRASEMYGDVDKQSGEWTTGVFAAMWGKMNQRNNRFSTWLVCDGPVDAIWIEDLNTVLDDNKILTLANGDRIPMTDQNKILFEVETLVNASPATVSRAGIIYVSESDLEWQAISKSWINRQSPDVADFVQVLFNKWVGRDGSLFIKFSRCEFDNPVIETSTKSKVSNLLSLLTYMLNNATLSETVVEFEEEFERLFVMCLMYSFGGLLEPEGLLMFDSYLRSIDSEYLPVLDGESSSFEYYVDLESLNWTNWSPDSWEFPDVECFDFSSLLVPTVDSTRACFLLESMHSQRQPVMLIGGSGTAKTSTVLMYLATVNPDVMAVKQINFSSATTMFGIQSAIEGELDKRAGKSFGPTGGKRLTVFLDDMSMPSVNEWGDQPTLEFVRQLIEFGNFAFLDKDKRGDMKQCEDLQFMGAMSHPGGGKNDIPNRLKRHFFIFNMVLPSVSSINSIYGQMLLGRFAGESDDTMDTVMKLTSATIELWQWAQRKFMPTPRKFHYQFNMRDVSRVFQGILLCPLEDVLHCKDPSLNIIKLWRHECERVFCDKLVDVGDKMKYLLQVQTVTESCFNQIHSALLFPPDLGNADISEFRAQSFVNFMGQTSEEFENASNESGDHSFEVRRTYELVEDMDAVKQAALGFMERQNMDRPAEALELVLFRDALDSLIKICRIVTFPKGSALLVGVGGSGKQSLTRLASYIAGNTLFQITVTKSYNINSLLDDMRSLYKLAGQDRRQVTFLFTDQEIKDESFLEVLNSLLLTGDIPGLFTKEEMIGLTADLEHHAVKERGTSFEATPASLRQYFIDSVRNNLHVVLCMSPVNPMFPERARKFPGVINCCTINWFLPWPEDALEEVASNYLNVFHPEPHGMYLREAQLPDPTPDEPPEMSNSQLVRNSLIQFMGTAHGLIIQSCADYEHKMRRNVYQTPKSFLSFLDVFMYEYEQELKKLLEKESRVTHGLEKLIQGAHDVQKLKIVLAEEKKKLEKATLETNSMIGDLETKSLEATKESEKVNNIKLECENDASRIQREKDECEKDLAAAQPYLDEAETAIKSIKTAHIVEVKKLAKPSDIIKLVFDGVLILFKQPLNPVKEATLTVKKQEITFIDPSYTHASKMMGAPHFLKDLYAFSAEGKDLINDETVELMAPYIEMKNFTASVAKSASVAAEGLCIWVRAMQRYHEASKIVKPKLEALQVASSELETAEMKLANACTRLDNCKQTLRELQDTFNSKLKEKAKVEEGAKVLEKKMSQASSLIDGLAGERKRWSEEKSQFISQKRRLVGDIAVSCAFVSYCGPFNQSFREHILENILIPQANKLNLPVSPGVNPIDFLADEAAVGDWNIDGLPSDPLSIQNGILVTRSSRYPLLIDPQGQALDWIVRKEQRIGRLPPFGVVQINSPKLKECLEVALSEGLTLIIGGVEQTVDPMLDPVLEKRIVRKGKSLYISIADKLCAYNPEFKMCIVTRLPNPHFSPELQAKTTVVDFTVTLKGLEDQLLDVVIGKEQKALQDQLEQVITDVAVNTKLLISENETLLYKLTSNSGSLLDDEELVTVLKSVKKTAETVTQKLRDAKETKDNINEKREQYRPVATRGAVLYFSIVETTFINIMYQTSLQQFMKLFVKSMDEDYSGRNSSVFKRVANIIDALTYITYRYINRGLYESDKLTFLLLTALKILSTTAGLNPSDVTLFLRGGAGFDADKLKKKPNSLSWMPDEVWLNVHAVSNLVFFRTLPEDIVKNESVWRQWYDDARPELLRVPDYEERFEMGQSLGSWNKLLLLRMMRIDRTTTGVREFIRSLPQMGPKYTEPVSDVIESIYEEMDCETPVIFLLSAGADPTDSIQALCYRKKKTLQVVSMGEGQESVAIKGLENARRTGNWLLLQNCELGLGLMNELEDILKGLLERNYEDMESIRNFRLFLTAAPHPDFPLGLLQISTKITNEPPAGIRAGLLRSYTALVDPDRMERVDLPAWRQMLFNLCFLHSVVQERKKYGALGWSTPYEFNSGDVTACILFLEKHLYSNSISWSTIQYMVGEVQYGGKITDDMDRRLFLTFTEKWITEASMSSDFKYNPDSMLNTATSRFEYIIPHKAEHAEYVRYINTLPEDDTPELFGLHPNADLTFRIKSVKGLLDQLSETRPKDSSGHGDRQDLETQVKQRCSELLSSMPNDFNMEEVKVLIDKRGGMTDPLNIFLSQEVYLIHKVLEKVRFDLVQLKLAIDGDVTLTSELQQAMNDINIGKVPHSWIWTIGGDEFSWISNSISKWFESLSARTHQFNAWLNNGRPNSYWLPGFKNPNAFLTSMKQEVTRLHRHDDWALDDVVYHSEVTDFATPEQIKSPPKEGIYVHGLFLEGARWEGKSNGHLNESEPKILFSPLPVLYFTATTMKLKVETRNSSPYECPLYRYTSRTGRWLITDVALSTKLKPEHWILRGVALVCNTE